MAVKRADFVGCVEYLYVEYIDFIGCVEWYTEKEISGCRFGFPEQIAMKQSSQTYTTVLVGEDLLKSSSPTSAAISRDTFY